MPGDAGACAFDDQLRTWCEFGWAAIDLECLMREHELLRWSEERRCTGALDERYARFLPAERWIGCFLAMEGHDVIALPRCDFPGTKSPDASVSGLLTEFKSYAGTSPRRLLGCASRASAQADHIVIHAVAMTRDPDIDRAFRSLVVSARDRGTRGAKLIGPDYHLEWGLWNSQFDESALSEPLQRRYIYA